MTSPSYVYIISCWIKTLFGESVMMNIDEIIEHLRSEIRLAGKNIKKFEKSYNDDRYSGLRYYGGVAATAAIKQKRYHEILLFAVDLDKDDNPVQKVIDFTIDKISYISGYENTMCSSCQFANFVCLKETEAYASLLLVIRREHR